VIGPMARSTKDLDTLFGNPNTSLRLSRYHGRRRYQRLKLYRLQAYLKNKRSSQTIRREINDLIERSQSWYS
jgi:hypothetical protein